MNEKEKMIEEMASDMDFACVELSKEQRIEIARTLINLDYCKAEPIRLTPEGYRKIIERIKLTTIGYGKEHGCYYADIIVTGQEFPQRIYFKACYFEREEIRKETAKEILKLVKEKSWCCQEDENGEVWTYSITVEQLKELADKYDVKVKE